MSRESLDQFCQDVIENEQLKEELGDLDEENFVRRVLEFGEERGYSFTQEELQEWIQETKEQQGLSYPMRDMENKAAIY